MTQHNGHLLKLAAAAQARVLQSGILMPVATPRKTQGMTAAPVTAAAPAAKTASLPNPALLQASQLGPPPVNDPINGPFLREVPTPLPDVLITVVFLILFALGAYVHLSIYRANAKRGHKFLLSDLIFDFCLVLVATCILRIIWAFVSVREVIWMAVISQNAGAVIGFNVNLFFTQRIFRAMHPSVGWHPVFTYGSYFLFVSIPIIGLTDAIMTIVSFYSAWNAAQLRTTERIFKVGASWTLALCFMPLAFLLLSALIPGPLPERFGTGRLRNKLLLLELSSSTLGVGASIRLDAVFHPEDGLKGSPLFSKPTLYLAGFVFELITVIAYAYFRVDLLFYVPNGAKKRGDYEACQVDEHAAKKMRIKHMVEGSFGQRLAPNNDSQQALSPTSFRPEAYEIKAPREIITPPDIRELPPRNVKVSRRQTLKDAIMPQTNGSRSYFNVD